VPQEEELDMTEIRPFLVNGQWRTGDGTFEVKSPYDDAVVAELGVPTEADVEEAVAVAAETFEESPRPRRRTPG
jgi:acyl-CoA reductase-like NAD-dependent aldehyde dehydrogenase